jgi:hypothetical protein
LAPRISERALISIAALAAVVHGFDELVVRPDFHEPGTARAVAAVVLVVAFVAMLIAAVRPPTQGRQTLVAAVGAAAFSAGTLGMLHEAGHDKTGAAAALAGLVLVSLTRHQRDPQYR